MAEALRPSVILSDLAFQNWLISNGLIVSAPIGDLLPPKRKVLKSHRTLYVLHDILQQNAGHLVSFDHLVKKLYPHTTIPSEHLLSLWCRELRQRLSSPNSLFLAPKLGIGLGITDVELIPHQVGVLYALWLCYPWSGPISCSDLAYVIHGDNSRSHQISVRRTLSTLRQVLLNNTAYFINFMPRTGPSRESYCQLDIKPTFTRHSLTPSCLDTKFMAWLASPELSLLTLFPKLGRYKKVSGAKLGQTEASLLAYLKSNFGKFQTLPSLSYAVYHNPDYSRRIIQLAGHLRHKLLNPEYVSTRVGLGVGFGIKHFPLSLSECDILHLLWIAKGEPVEIRLAISKSRIRSILRSLNSKLSNSGLAVKVLLQGPKTSKYQLVGISKL